MFRAMRARPHLPQRTAATNAPRRTYAKDKGGGVDKAAAQAAENKAIKDRAAAETRNLQGLEQQIRVVEKDDTINEPVYPFRESRLEVLREEIGPEGMRPHLTQKTRDMMFSLHKSNPTKWTDDALAKKFGLLTSRVRAILYLKELEQTARERGEWIAPDDSLDEAYEQEFGKNLDEDINHEEFLGRMPTQMFIDDELDPAEMRARMKMLAPLEDELGPVPPKDWPDQPTVLRKPQAGKPRKYKSKVLLIDSSKNVKDKERMILISDDDGTLRTASWTERRAVLNQSIITRTTSGRRNLFLPMGGAEKLQRYRRERENMAEQMYMHVDRKDQTTEDRTALEAARRALTSYGATHGYKRMKDYLKFSDEPLPYTPPPELQLGPNQLPELQEGTPMSNK